MTPVIFNRRRLASHRARASAQPQEAADFLLREMAERLADRLSDIRREFPVALDLGAHHGVLADLVQERGGIKTLVQCDLSADMVSRAPGLRVVADEEFLPFGENSFDLIMSVGALHWVNDLPGALIQIQRALKPDGLFLAVLPGGETLKELRESLEQAEMKITGGISPRISPFIDVQAAGSLLQRAGFALPVVDSDSVTVSYPDPLKLMQDLRNMGETNALAAGAKGFTRRDVLFSAMEYYEQHHAHEGRLPATFELITLTGWKPHASQQQPARRGSGKVGLKDALH
jgi:NADH dehydrogenase [ubiquinone] 1 alpha subcomplex assembly factor 5